LLLSRTPTKCKGGPCGSEFMQGKRLAGRPQDVARTPCIEGLTAKSIEDGLGGRCITARRIAARKRQVEIGKARPEYLRYVQSIPPDRRTPTRPCTPDPTASVSKRQFDRQLSEWRRRLHEYDENTDGTVEMPLTNSVVAELPVEDAPEIDGRASARPALATHVSLTWRSGRQAPTCGWATNQAQQGPLAGSRDASSSRALGSPSTPSCKELCPWGQHKNDLHSEGIWKNWPMKVFVPSAMEDAHLLWRHGAPVTQETAVCPDSQEVARIDLSPKCLPVYVHGLQSAAFAAGDHAGHIQNANSRSVARAGTKIHLSI